MLHKRGFWTEEDVSKATDLLWERVGCALLGDRHRRRGSVKCPKKSRLCQDLLEALVKLDKESMMPRIGVDALELAFIPRSMPAELNNITLADRLAKLELVIEKMGEHVERAITENGSLHGRILLLEKKAADAVVKKATYASRLASDRPLQSTAPLLVPTVEPSARYSGGGAAAMSTLPGSVTAESVDATLDAHVYQACTAVADDDEFVVQRSSRRKQIRRDNINSRPSSRVVVGAKRGPAKSQGAPEPSRDLFIFRVQSDADLEDIRSHVDAFGVTIRDLVCMSNENAAYKSFRLTTTVAHYNTLFKADMWPAGVMVRKFIPPRRDTT